MKAKKKMKKILIRKARNLILALTVEDSRMSCTEPQKGLKHIQCTWQAVKC